MPNNLRQRARKVLNHISNVNSKMGSLEGDYDYWAERSLDKSVDLLKKRQFQLYRLINAAARLKRLNKLRYESNRNRKV